MTATKVRERPIIFSAESVRAILDGRKTQTRRVVRLPKQWTIPPARLHEGRINRYGCDPSESIACPYGVPSDRLWVKETWGCVDFIHGVDEPSDAPYCQTLRDERGNAHDVVYRADAPDFEWDADSGGRWRSPIHMPRWASRLTLEVTDVRVERLQEISEADAIAEGCGRWDCGEPRCTEKARWHGPVGSFMFAWDRLNAKRGYPWESNPWVWVIEFRRV